MNLKYFKSRKVKIFSFIFVAIIGISILSSYPFAKASLVSDEVPVISGNYIRGIKEEQSCSQFKSIYTDSIHGYSYSLYSIDGKYISTSNVKHNVSTGDYIKDVANNVYTLVVTGDIDGNGKVNTTDAAVIKFHFSQNITLTDAPYQAADTNNDKRLTATDYLRIKYHIQSKYNIHDNESFIPDESEDVSDVETSNIESGWTSGWA